MKVRNRTGAFIVALYEADVLEDATLLRENCSLRGMCAFLPRAALAAKIGQLAVDPAFPTFLLGERSGAHPGTSGHWPRKGGNSRPSIAVAHSEKTQ